MSRVHDRLSAGVNYAELFEHARAEAEQSGTLNSTKRNFIRAFTLRWLFMDLSRCNWQGGHCACYHRQARLADACSAQRHP